MPLDDNDLHRANPGAFDPLKDIEPFTIIPGGRKSDGKKSRASKAHSPAAGEREANAAETNIPPGTGGAAPPPPSSDSRAEILITTHERAVNDAALAALANVPSLYKRGFLLVHVVEDKDYKRRFLLKSQSAVRVAEVPPGRFREMLTECIRFMKFDRREGMWVPAHPPDFAVQALLCRGDWPGIRDLAGIAETPMLRPDGTIVDQPGYDEKTGLLYIPSATFPPIPAAPTQKEAAAALAEIADVVCDFPFVSPAHRATWIAAVLTIFARHAFTGPAPLFLFDANVRGAGKSKLADLVSLIATGLSMARMGPTDDDAEMRKRITSMAIAADTMVLIDNVVGALGTPSLDAALTAEGWKDRLLGSNEQRVWPLCVTWFATGNNIVLLGDLSRRCIHARLESPEERPELRDSFKHPDLLEWVRAERARLAVAALTVLRAFYVAGQPEPRRLPAWGSFEGWSRVVRRALVWAGEADPAETREELELTADSDAAALGDLIRGWEEVARMNGGRCTVAQAVSDLQADSSGRRFEALRAALAELCPTKPGTFPSNKSIGKLLSRFRGRVVGGKAIVLANEKGEHGREWAVKSALRKENAK